MDAKAALLRDIDAFLAERAISATSFGRRAVNDGKFVSRIRGGGGLTLATVDKVRDFIATSKIAHRQPDAAA